MAGTWLAVVYGFAGLRVNSGKLELKPYVPEAWEGYSFTIRYQGETLLAELNHEERRFTLTEGKALHFWLEGREIILSERRTVTVKKYKALFLTGMERQLSPARLRRIKWQNR